MKCSTCGNIIPDGMNVCPNCGNALVNTGLPATPESPILPGDQQLEAAPVLPAVELDNTVNPTSVAIPDAYSSQPVVNQPSQVEEAVQEKEAPNIMMVSDETMTNIPTDPTSVLGNAPVVASVDAANYNSPVQMPNAPVNNQVNVETNYIDPNGTVVAEKIGSSVGKEEPQNKKKWLPLIILLIVFVVCSIIGGIISFIVYTQYNTANTRLEKVIDTALLFTNTIHNDDIEKKSGTFNVEGNMSYDTSTYYAKFNGTYAADLSARKIKFNTELEELSLNNDDMINKHLNLELYYGDSNLYVLMSDFFDKYIYQGEEKLEEFLVSIEQNDINYPIMIASLKKAFIKSVLSMSNTQDVVEAVIDGKSMKANEITIKLTKGNVARFESALINTLKADQAFMNEYNKSFGQKNKLEDVFDIDQDSYEDRNVTVKVNTSMFSKELYSISIRDAESKTTTEIVNNNDGTYKVVQTLNGKKKMELSYTLEKKKTMESVESNYLVKFVYLKEEVAYTFDFKLNLVEDVNPKDPTVKVKESVKKEYLTEEEKNSILTKSSEIGSLGIELPKMIEKYLTDGIEQPTEGEIVGDPTVNCIPDELTNCVQ